MNRSAESAFSSSGVAADHSERNRQSFTEQAEAYASSPIITNEERLARLVNTVAPGPEDRLLEVASGPGHVALAFAPRCREVVGLDLTPAPTRIAERNARERGITNATFRPGDAYDLPFAAGEFDIVVCRYAFHHFEHPLRALREMSRCCRPGGRVAVEDLVASEHPARAAFQDRAEILRDPSHSRALPLSEMLGLFALSGLEVEAVQTGKILQDAEAWLQEVSAPSERAQRALELLEQDAREDLSLVRPFRDPAGRLHFTHTTAIVVGRRL